MAELGAQQLIWLVLGTTFGVALAVALLAARRARAADEDDGAQERLKAFLERSPSADEPSASEHAGHEQRPAKAVSSEAPELPEKTTTREKPAPIVVPKLDEEEEDADVDPTKVAAVDVLRVAEAAASEPEVEQPPVLPRVFDTDAEEDEPTHVSPLILTSASAQTDAGLRRRQNEDSLLVADRHGLYVVADGMGGYAGGELASQLAVKVIAEAFETNQFAAEPHDDIPRRASELARAIQMANAAIYAEAKRDPKLEGMGTTVVAARFSVNKQRLYVAHAGDSRMYRVRDGLFEQITQDHTMSTLGVQGPQGDYLSRAVGIWPVVPVDVGFVKPLPGDLYLLCSDGLTKMVGSKDILAILEEEKELGRTAERLVDAANANGGKDNVTVILVRVDRAPSA